MKKEKLRKAVESVLTKGKTNPFVGMKKEKEEKQKAKNKAGDGERETEESGRKCTDKRGRQIVRWNEERKRGKAESNDADENESLRDFGRCKEGAGEVKKVAESIDKDGRRVLARDGRQKKRKRTRW